MDDLEILDSYIKTPGGIEIQQKKCGKPNCKCAQGSLHTAYRYRYWKFQGGRYMQVRKYLNKEVAIKLNQALERYKTEFSHVVRRYEVHRKGFVQSFRSGASLDMQFIENSAVLTKRLY